MNKRLAFIFAVCFIFVSKLAAQSVCVEMIQIDSTQKEPRYTSVLLQEAVLDSLYEAGYIVTDNPVVNVSRNGDVKNALKKDLKDALDGGCSSFVSMIAEYDKDITTDPDYPSLSGLNKIKWAVMTVDTKKVLKEGMIDVTQSGELDTEDGIKNVVASILSEIKSSIVK